MAKSLLHRPFENVSGPWDCIDRACPEYEDTDGNDRPEVAHCSHVTVIVMCEACAEYDENKGIRFEVPWTECILRQERQRDAQINELNRASAALRTLAPSLPGTYGRLADPVAQLLEHRAQTLARMLPGLAHDDRVLAIAKAINKSD